MHSAYRGVQILSEHLRDHRGVMEFTATDTGSRLVYTISFGAVVPGLDRLVKIGLERNVRNGLKTVDAKA